MHRKAMNQMSKHPLRSILPTLLVMMVLVIGSVPAHSQPGADFTGFWTAKYERTPTGAALFEKIPKNAVFIDDAGAGELAEGDFSGLVLSKEAQAAVKAYDFDSEFDQEKTCVPPSAAFYMQAPFPIEIHQADKLIVLKIEYFDMVRLIFLDGREIPVDAPLSKNGYSVGHWDGDELVVETGRLSPATFMNNGFDHSENLKMTERFKISSDSQTLWLIQIYEDPEVFTGIGARYMAWSKREGEYVYPYECDFSSFGQ